MRRIKLWAGIGVFALVQSGHVSIVPSGIHVGLSGTPALAGERGEGEDGEDGEDGERDEGERGEGEGDGRDRNRNRDAPRSDARSSSNPEEGRR